MDKYYSSNLLLLFVVFIGSATAFSICISTGNYTDGSPYGDNLNGALVNITASINKTGFNYASFGQEPDAAHALLLCRADVSVYDCQDCKKTAVLELQTTCPNRKQAISWQELCTLKYSDDAEYGNPQIIWYRYYMWNAKNVTSPVRFRQDLRGLLEDLRNRAANGRDSMKAAVGNVSAPDLLTIFAMVQCTPDLSPEDCKGCLTSAAGGIHQFCDGNIGCRVLLERCFLRYETSLFYNETRIPELMMPTLFLTPPPPPDIIAPVVSPPPPPGSNDNKTRTVIIFVVISVAVVVIVIFVIIVYSFFTKRTNWQRGLDHVEDNGEISTVESLRYDFSMIRDATNDFSEENKLGQGGFGAVCKGKLSNGQEIAVKRLSNNSGQGDVEFKNEVLLLAKLQHRNLVKLLGFALQGAEKLLVYEFVQNASLDKYIFDPVKRSLLDWDRRLKIIGGIARGILYLHEDSRLRIIHRDLKASNVLLDSEMNPKIADFGMARLFVQNDQTEGSTDRIVGTYGYMAPEYAMHGQFSIKSDVFSFGVLLLEIVTGQKNACFVNEDETFQDLLSFAWKNWQEGTCANVIDPILKSGCGTSIREMMRCIHIGLLCVQDKVVVRPTMASVVLMLCSSSNMTTLALPTEPANFFVQGIGYDNVREFDTNDTASSVRSARTSNHDLPRNEVSITESYLPR